MCVPWVEAMEREVRGVGVVQEVVKGGNDEWMGEWVGEEGV